MFTKDVAYCVVAICSRVVSLATTVLRYDNVAVKNIYITLVCWHCGQNEYLTNAKFPLYQNFAVLTNGLDSRDVYYSQSTSITK